MEKTKFALDIEKLSERPKHAKMLVYGDSGVGKTVFASSAPRPMLWIESEGGTNSIADPKGIDIVKASGLDTYREALQYLRSDEGRKYKTVVLDSFTETQASVLKEIMVAVHAADGTRDEFTPQFQEYQRLVGVMREIVRGFRDLPMHVVVTALTREDKDELTGRTAVRPRLSPAIASEIPGFMDVVGYMYTTTEKIEDQEVNDDQVEIHRNFLCVSTGKYLAKVRAPEGTEIPSHLKSPKFKDVAKYVLGEEK